VRFFAAFLIAVFFLASHGTPAQAAHQKRFTGFVEDLWGFGAQLGNPSGVHAQKFIDWKRAWSFSVGYSFDKVVLGSIDYLMYGYDAADKMRSEDFFNALIFYWGPGIVGGPGLSGSDPNDSFRGGVRVVGGAEYVFLNSPWSIRLELGPTLYFKAKNNFDVGIGVGATYYLFDSAKARAQQTRLRRVHKVKTQRDDGSGTPATDETEFEEGVDPGEFD
jgi:hypothetical protein